MVEAEPQAKGKRDGGKGAVAAALAPSKLLEVYRCVARREPIDECDVWVAELKIGNPRQFMLDLAKMEKEYAEACARVQQPAAPSSEQVDAGEALRVALKWLRENGVEDG